MIVIVVKAAVSPTYGALRVVWDAEIPQLEPHAGSKVRVGSATREDLAKVLSFIPDEVCVIITKVHELDSVLDWANCILALFRQSAPPGPSVLCAHEPFAIGSERNAFKIGSPATFPHLLGERIRNSRTFPITIREDNEIRIPRIAECD